MRNQAYALDVHEDVKDGELLRFLDDAELSFTKGRVYRGGETLQATEPTFLLEGLIQLGETNIIVGQPKVGKSSFMIGFAAALRDRRPQFLGRDIALPSERMPVLIFGTDQSEGNWLHFLKREGLTDLSQTLDTNAVDFFCDIDSSNVYNFTRTGLQNMREEIEKHQFPLVIIDSLSSMMEATGIEENTSRYATPIRNAIRELRKTGATLVIIHHAVKRPNTWDWIVECRGSSSISSAFSWGILMRWVALEDDGLVRTDRRVGFTGKGRGAAEAGGVMGRYESEGGWTYLDGLEAAQQVEKVKQRIGELGGVRGQVFDYLTMRTELGADVSADELATELNKNRSNINREVSVLKSRGLVEVVRLEETGSRPRQYWMLSTPAQVALDLQTLCHTTDFSDTFDQEANLQTQCHTTDFSDTFDQEALNIKRMMVFDSQGRTAVLPESAKESSPFAVGTTVELQRPDGWQNGWLVHEVTADGLITAAKVGSPMKRVPNLRPDLDVRPCASAFSSQANSEPVVRSGEAPVHVPGEASPVVDHSHLLTRHGPDGVPADSGDQTHLGTERNDDPQLLGGEIEW